LTQQAKKLALGEGESEQNTNTALIDGVRKFAMDVRELDIDLIDRINPFGEAYAILAKTMSENRLKQVAAAIAAKRTNLSPDEAKELAVRPASRPNSSSSNRLRKAPHGQSLNPRSSQNRLERNCVWIRSNDYQLMLKGRWEFLYAESFCSSEINSQFESCWVLNRKIARVRPFENYIDV
jgi:hypothetical protein